MGLVSDRLRKNIVIQGTAALFLIYFFAAAKPVPEETVLRRRWLTSFESGDPSMMEGEKPETSPGEPIPFLLAGRYGYVGEGGVFTLNVKRKGGVSISERRFAEYEAVPQSINVFDPQKKLVMTIKNPGGYPVFLDNRVFLVGSEQNSITALDSQGNERWTHVFSGPLTCVDAAGGFLLAGSLDGVVELLDEDGNTAAAPFEPGGSRLSIILGCALSQDASRCALVSGVDDQRFLLLEWSGDTYKVAYHEFISDGYRKPVRVAFVDGDTRVAYEREGGIGVYDITNRVNAFLPLEGEVCAMDEAENGKLLFLVSDQGDEHKLFAAVEFPDTLLFKAPFKSNSDFLGRRGNRVYLAGDNSLASFETGKK